MLIVESAVEYHFLLEVSFLWLNFSLTRCITYIFCLKCPYPSQNFHLQLSVCTKWKLPLGFG
uniref:Uncharacterized protein n=1 Tax=Arundo donax TaxID=35708 RepID=A0A0A8YY09_ARUDO